MKRTPAAKVNRNQTIELGSRYLSATFKKIGRNPQRKAVRQAKRTPLRLVDIPEFPILVGSVYLE